MPRPDHPPHEFSRTSWVAGAVLETPDVQASADFLAALTGWRGSATTTGCTLQTVDGVPTAAVVRASQGRWVPVFTVAGGPQGLVGAQERAVSHGCELHADWLVAGAVRVTDPWGNVFGLLGTEAAEDELESLAPWLGEVDLAVVQRREPLLVYRSVLELDAHEIPDFDYVLLHRPGRPVMGLWAPGGEFADSLWDPLGAGWAVHFAVEDCDTAVSLAAALGAQVTVPTTDSPVGAFATFRDPWGVPFGVCQRNADAERLAGAVADPLGLDQVPLPGPSTVDVATATPS